MALVRRLENFFVIVFRQRLVADVGTDIGGELEGPQGTDGGVAAAAVQLDRLLTHVIDDLMSQL